MPRTSHNRRRGEYLRVPQKTIQNVARHAEATLAVKPSRDTGTTGSRFTSSTTVAGFRRRVPSSDTFGLAFMRGANGLIGAQAPGSPPAR